MTRPVTFGTASMLCLLLVGGLSACGGRARETQQLGVTQQFASTTFRSGVAGYLSSADVAISSQNGGNGVTDRTATELITWRKTGTGAYDAESMIRFDNLSLPPGSHVTSAQLTLTFENWWTGFTLRGYYLKNAWNAAPSAPLGWLNRDTGLTWNTPGALGSGSDVYSGSTFSNSTWTGTGDEVRTFELDPTIVQSWVDNPATNQGVLLVNNQSNDVYLRIYASEDATVTRRPLLTINYDSQVCATAAIGTWQNASFTSQPGSFSVEYDATPSAAAMDAVIGLAQGAQSAYTGLAVVTRFAPTGFIDARNGAVYAASTQIPYTQGTPYHFRLAVNVATHTYSVFVRSGAGAEQTLATNFAFRTEQGSVTSLNDWAAFSEAGGTLQVCGFSMTPGTGADTTPPTVSLTAPANGSTVSGSISLSASATDAQSGVAGVQFLVDGGAIGSEDTAAPYALSYNTSGLTNGSHTFSARARDAASNSATSSGVTVTVNNASATASHPRIWLDASTLQSLRQKAQQASLQWTTLRDSCNSYVPGVVLSPSTADCNTPNICRGYQGESFVNPAFSIALCYQIGLGIGDANTTSWGNKGADILTRMAEVTETSGPDPSTGLQTWRFSTDGGYGIRNYAVTMAVLYDWLYGSPALSASLKSTVATRLSQWVSWFEQNGASRDEPHANYFAGYYATKAYAALATEGDPGATSFADFVSRVQQGGAGSIGTHSGVAAYYSNYLSGGGWAEGWQYGAQSIVHMSLPSLAALTAKNVDLINDAAHPYQYPLANGMHLIQFTWPSRNYLDDRDTIRSGSACPGTAQPSAYAYSVVAALLGKWGNALAPQFHKYARDVRAAGVAAAPAWADFLFWDDAAAEQAYTSLPRSFLAKDYVAMRNDWATTSVWASLRAMGYVGGANSGEQYPDAGALAIVRGGTPFLVNPGFAHRCYGNDTAPPKHDDQIYAHIYGGTHPTDIFNTFYNGSTGQLYGAAVSVDKASPPATHVTRFEDRNGYVLVRAQDLEDVYPAASNITAWSRDVVFFRPSRFVVYDRTTVANTSGNQHMNWLFPPTPQSATAPSGVRRWNVQDSFGFKGTLTTLLPTNASVTPVDVFGDSRLFRLEVAPPSGTATTDSRWLTVLDAAATSTDVALGSVVSSSTNVKGALLTAATGNSLALFGAGAVGQVVTGDITFSEPAVTSKVVIADLTPNTGYAVSTVASGSNHNVTVRPGTGFTTSEYGTLYVNIDATGLVTAGN